MLGWSIYIYRQDLIEDPEVIWPHDRALLASWLTGMCGLDWLDALVKEGKATCLGGNGYPLKYVAPAANVLPLIFWGPPKYHGPRSLGMITPWRAAGSDSSGCSA